MRRVTMNEKKRRHRRKLAQIRARSAWAGMSEQEREATMAGLRRVQEHHAEQRQESRLRRLMGRRRTR